MIIRGPKKKFWTVQPVWGKAAGGPAFSLTYQSSAAVTTTGVTTLDYGTLSYGSGNTRVIVAIQYIGGGTGGTVSGVSVGGVSLAAVPGAATNSGAAGVFLDIWESTSALAGTSGDVQVTFAIAPSWHSAVALYNLKTSSPTVSAVGVNPTSATSAPVTLNIPAGGGGIILAANYSGEVASLTNATMDADVDTNNYVFGHTTVTGASQTITPTWATNTLCAASVAVWGP